MLVACGGGGTEPFQQRKPNAWLKNENSYLPEFYWSAGSMLNNTPPTGWVLSINGAEQDIAYDGYFDTFSLSHLVEWGLTEPKTYAIKIKALGNGTTFLDSDWSDTITFIMRAVGLTAPTNARVSGKTLLWDAAEKADGYILFISPAGYTGFSQYGELITETSRLLDWLDDSPGTHRIFIESISKYYHSGGTSVMSEIVYYTVL